MKKLLIVVVALVGLLVLGVAGFLMSAKSKVDAALAKTYETHAVDLPVPMPLTEDEVAQLAAERRAELPPEADGSEAEGADGAPQAPADPLAGVDLSGIALERAIARGEHLVQSRYVCVECHGKDFSGGVMVDDPAIGQWLGPNLTAGAGGVTRDYTTADWDRIVRHGVKPSGTAAVMPSEDFLEMSDQELSDIIAYIGTFPPKDNTVAPVSFGPVGLVLASSGAVPLSAEVVQHDVAHRVHPPASEPTPEFGAHLAQVCVGCHRKDLSGGPIAVGPPDWAPAGNLTPSEDGLGAWTFEQFDAALRTGVRPDGSPFKTPMDVVSPYMKHMTEIEMQAMWAYLRSIPPLPTGA